MDAIDFGPWRAEFGIIAFSRVEMRHFVSEADSPPEGTVGLVVWCPHCGHDLAFYRPGAMAIRATDHVCGLCERLTTIWYYGDRVRYGP